MARKFIFAAIISCFSFLSISQPPSTEKMAEARERFNAGVKYGIDENFEDAIAEFAKAIELNPLYAEAFLYLGLAKIELGEYDLAIRNFTIAIELDPAFSDQAHYFRGLAKYYNEDYASAIDDLTIAIRMNPDFVSFYQRGKANLQLKEYRRALQDFDIALRLKEDFPEGFLYRGINLYYLENYQEAMKDLDLALLHLPGNDLAQKYAGLTARRLSGRYDEEFAIADQTQAPERKDYTLKESQTISEPKASTSASDIHFAQLFSPSDDEQLSADDNDPAKESLTPHTSPAETENLPMESIEKPSIENVGKGTFNRYLDTISLSGFGVQLASYSNTANLMQLAEAYEEKYENPVFINVSDVNGRTLYKLIIGKFDQRMQAEEFRDYLRQGSFPDSFLVVFDNL